MNLSKTLLLIPAGSFVLAAAVASGACSSSVSIDIPSNAVGTYSGTLAVPDGITFGKSSCEGYSFFALGNGYGFCDAGIWEYTADDPTTFGDYTVDTSVSAGSNSTGPTPTGSTTSGSTTSGSTPSGSTTSGSTQSFPTQSLSTQSFTQSGFRSSSSHASGSGSIPPYAIVVYTGTCAVPGGIVFGVTRCDGDTYFVFAAGWSFCDNGVWEYTDFNPASFGLGYTVDTNVEGGGCSTSTTSTSASGTTQGQG
jgi:hypothetical protein